ncbi:methyl-accepting chemotaxis protein [Pseudoduganella sp. R-43]|uniref:methyl-accepting chemotaxis protein n=1 Tax=Pseudoduganella sp. R-43 TaxID=3404063 RepID=UPI003CF95849
MSKQSMKVGTRLALGFGLVLALMAGVSGLGIFNMHRIHAQLEKVVRLNVAKLTYVQDMSEAVHVVARVTRTLVLLSDEAAMQRELPKIQAARAQYDKAQAALEALPATEEGKAIRARIRALQQESRSLTDQLLQLAMQHKDDEAVALLMQKAGPATQRWQDVMDEDVQLQRQHNARDAAAATEAYAAARSMMLVMSGVALVAGVVASTLIARRLLGQLGGEPDVAAEIAGRIAAGDLTVHVETRQDDEASMMKAISMMRDSLLRIVSEVRQGTETINTAATQIAAGNLDLSSRTEQQASALEETASSMEELTSAVRENGNNARQANELAAAATAVAQQGGAVVGQVVQTMGSISDSSRKISDIIGVIDGIAFQTNILALNAAVEAARAGEQGRGFAVVATEVRQLAQRSAAAAKEIKDLIVNSVEQVDQGSALVARAGSTMDEVVASVQRVSEIMREITAAGDEQSAGIEQINRAVTEMDTVTQQNAALVEEAASAADALKQQAAHLDTLVSVFKLHHDVARRTANSRMATKQLAAISPPAMT